MNFDELFAEFNEIADNSERKLERMLKTVSSGRVPTKEERTEFNKVIDALCERYDLVCSFSKEKLMEEELPDDGSSAEDYYEAIKGSRYAEQQRQIGELKEVLTKFISVQSLVEYSANALEPFQKEAGELLKIIEKIEDIIADVTEEAKGPRLFMHAMEYPDLNSDEGNGILDSLEEAYGYPSKVTRGLVSGSYFLPDEKAGEGNQALPDGESGDENSALPDNESGDENPALPDGESGDENQVLPDNESGENEDVFYEEDDGILDEEDASLPDEKEEEAEQGNFTLPEEKIAQEDFILPVEKSQEENLTPTMEEAEEEDSLLQEETAEEETGQENIITPEAGGEAAEPQKAEIPKHARKSASKQPDEREPKQQLTHRIVTFAIVLVLTLLSLEFVNWICRMAFENTCTELEEQYLTTEISEIIENMESSINFGKELDNYYGINDVFERVANLSDQELDVIILDDSAEPLYTSFEASDESVSEFAYVYTTDYKTRLLKTESMGTRIEFGKNVSLVFPIYKEDVQLVGYMAVYYDDGALISDEYKVGTQGILFAILAAVAVFALVFSAFFDKAGSKMLSAFMMVGMLCYIIFLFFTYRESYNTLVQDKAAQASVSIQNILDGMIDKGLSVDDLHLLDDWLEEKENTSETITNLRIQTDAQSGEVSADTMVYPIGDGEAQFLADINQDYIKDKINLMTLTFGAVFVVCLMIAFELANMTEILNVRFSDDFNRDTPAQYSGISAQIRLLSFLGYVAIYISTPYAAVIMRSWDASVFGLSKAVSASLPLTVELICVPIASAIMQRVYRDARPKRLMGFVFPFLILGNYACTRVTSPIMLIALRAFCGFGFAFMKYWLNGIVAIGSNSDKSFRENCAKLNVGLLGGITAGASLGSIFAQALGYQSNYMFTAAILLILCILAVLTMPWKLLDENRKRQMLGGATSAEEVHPTEKVSILKNHKAMSAILFGCIPLNVGLMYVVAFVPSYMASIGQSAIATSYVYIVNGLAGMYLGMMIVNFMKRKSLYVSGIMALVLAAVGILILPMSKSLFVVMLSAAIMGVFDGFGTPSITGYFTGLFPDSTQTANMLTTFNMVGSAVQIVCPMLYNFLIQPDGRMTYLIIFGAGYLLIAALFLMLGRPKKGETV